MTLKLIKMKNEEKIHWNGTKWTKNRPLKSGFWKVFFEMISRSWYSKMKLKSMKYLYNVPEIYRYRTFLQNGAKIDVPISPEMPSRKGDK